MVYTDGKLECGLGAAIRDVNLCRSSADVLRPDDSLYVGINLRINTPSLGSSSGVIAAARRQRHADHNPPAAACRMSRPVLLVPERQLPLNRNR